MRITTKINEVDTQLQKTEEKIERLEEKSFAMEMLEFSNRQLEINNKNLGLANRRSFIIIIVLILALCVSVGYNIYLTNDMSTVDTEITQENQDGYNNYIGNDGDITYGKANDKN